MNARPKRYKKLKGKEFKSLLSMLDNRILKLINRYNTLVEEYYSLKKKYTELKKVADLSKQLGVAPSLSEEEKKINEQHEAQEQSTDKEQQRNIAIDIASLDRAMWYVFKLITSYREYVFATVNGINPDEYKQKFLKTLEQIDKRIGSEYVAKVKQLVEETDFKTANGETKAHVNDTVKLLAIDILLKVLGIKNK
jgi:formate dehydrogenase maturation protein FdhE